MNSTGVMTLVEISQQMHLTRERVRQIQEEALGKLFKKTALLFPQFDDFEIMAIIITGLSIHKKVLTRSFYHSFPDNVKKRVYKAAFKYAPYMEKVEYNKLRTIFVEDVDKEEEE